MLKEVLWWRAFSFSYLMVRPQLLSDPLELAKHRGQPTARYYNLDNGSISIGGIPIDHIPLNTLRANIGLVSQDPFLFDTTVRENLTSG